MYQALLDGAVNTVSMSDITSLVSTVMGMLTSYPLNIFLGCGLGCAGFKVFKAAKRASK